MLLDDRNRAVGRVSMHREPFGEAIVHHGASLIHFYRSENSIHSHYQL